MHKKTFIIAAQNIFKEVGICDGYITLDRDFDTYEFANDMSRELAGIFNISIVENIEKAIKIKYETLKFKNKKEEIILG
ncbi:hypothetical protein [Clostridium tyrobutyricum]|jgi:hypothetical protein|uniref:hypothetical protein n=1 Tax=Clostridium tyrobutyricum TaxID=1519 RepID=UPI001C38BCD2|nr:hypothetical protein [Clostridium tyrobutyricum]MBV4428861.1 hypothetical protein [Clostridium tyrobutyricum]MBV4444850.1 hypothetical protein [Clostridium tyrobutyricum]